MARTSTAGAIRVSPSFRYVAGSTVLLMLAWSGITVIDSLTATDLGGGTESIRLARETFANGLEDVVDVSNHQLVLQTGDEAAAGDSAPGVEAAPAPYPDARTTLVDGNYTYRFDMHEVAPDSWQVGDDFVVEVYGYDGVSSSLLGTLYTQQGSADDANVEGVTVSVDSGSTDEHALTYSIVITRQ